MLEKFTKKVTKDVVDTAKEEAVSIAPYALLMGFAVLAGVVGLLDTGKPLPPMNRGPQITIYKF